MAGTFCDDVSVSSNTTLGAAHMNHLILATAGAGGITLTLPDNATWHNSYTCIWRVDSAAGNVVIARAGTDTINGVTSITLSNQYETVCLYSNGAGLWEAVFGSRLLTAGSVPFVGADGLPAEDNANLFWEASSRELDVTSGTGTPNNYAPIYSLNSLTGGDGGYYMGLRSKSRLINITNDSSSVGLDATGAASASAPTAAQVAGIFAIADVSGDFTDTTQGQAGIIAVFTQGASGTVAKASGISILAPETAGGLITDYAGLRIDDQGAANSAIKTGLGTVDFGDMLQLSRGFTVAAGGNVLPTPVVGMVARVTDALAPAVGAVLAGGGAAAALVWYNGTNWTVIGV